MIKLKKEIVYKNPVGIDAELLQYLIPSSKINLIKCNNSKQATELAVRYGLAVYWGSNNTWYIGPEV